MDVTAIIIHDGKTYPYISSPRDMTINEMKVVSEFFGDQFNTVFKVQLNALQALAWASIHRHLPDFTLEEAGDTTVGAVTDAQHSSTVKAAAVAAGSDLPEGMVLTPTNAASVPRKRTPVATSSTPRSPQSNPRSRKSSTSGHGK
jgi:hypothetical protein